MEGCSRVLICLVAFLAVCGLAIGANVNVSEGTPFCNKSRVPTLQYVAKWGPSQNGTQTNISAGPDANEAEPNIPAETVADPNKIGVAVTINGVDITESDVEALIKPQLEKMAAQLPLSVVEQYKKQLRQQALESMIVEQLLDEKVKVEKIVVTEEEIIDHIKAMASQQKLSMEDFKALIEAYGQSFDEIKQRIQRGLGYQKLMEAQFAGKINVTEDDARKYYSENKSEFEQVRASHILIQPDTADPNTDPNETKAKARAKTQELLKQIKGGADFAELAKANSSCSSAARGGDLNFFRRGQMVPAFEKVAFKLKVGQASDIVETRFGYHIIKVTERKDAGVTQFKQNKDDIIKMLTQKKQAELAMQYIESLKAKANIVYPVRSKTPTSNGVYPADKEPNSVPRRP